MWKRKNRGFSGTVEGVELQVLIQMACIGGQTSTITASRGNQKGYLYIVRGRPLHASAAGVAGQEALNELLSWRGGRLDWRLGVPRNLTQSLSGSHDALLLEAMRVLDERSDGLEDPEVDQKGKVELSRGSAAAILELIYARRRQERWLTRTKRILIGLAAVMVTILSGFLVFRSDVGHRWLNGFWITINGFHPQPVPKYYGAPARIDAGEFFYQDGERRTLQAYEIDRVEVTIGQYAEFLRAVGSSTEYDHPNQALKKGHSNAKWDELYQAAVAGLEFEGARLSVNDPAVYLDWFDAWAYARWKRRRLPSEEEWEKAARGTDGRRFPWGSDERTGAANIYEGDAAKKWSEPTAYPLDQSVYGIYDMAGNVSEWTETIDVKTELPVVRGGNFGNSSAEIMRRVVNQPFTTQSDRIGFRTARSLP
jgi:Sulfatase-modifying factor enzyme 1/Domain of unknown function (DUF4388)